MDIDPEEQRRFKIARARERVLHAVRLQSRANEREHGGPDHDDTHIQEDWLRFILKQLAFSVSRDNGEDPDARIHGRRINQIANGLVVAMTSWPIQYFTGCGMRLFRDRLIKIAALCVDAACMAQRYLDRHGNDEPEWMKEK